MIDLEKFKADIARDEGLRLKPYRDTLGKLTIGYGRNLDDRGISKSEAEIMRGNDIALVLTELDSAFPWWTAMPEQAARGLANMAYNLGLTRLKGFVNMLAALKRGDFEVAAQEALDSRWARQVGGRAGRISALYSNVSVAPDSPFHKDT